MPATTDDAEPNPYPVGFQRPDFPKLYSWSDFKRLSGRTEAPARYLRSTCDDFPVPVAVWASGPIYLACEIEAFCAAHPKRERAHQIPDTDVRLVYRLADRGIAQKDIAEAVGISAASVSRFLHNRHS